VLDGAVVGYGWLDWWTEADGTNLFLLLGIVDPAARRQGVGTTLLAQQQTVIPTPAAVTTANQMRGPRRPLIFR
jgi:GNAT superfamily N-acetyltransferase